MDELKLEAPAKINLCLNILGRRADGYHELQTVFQLLDFYDELEFQADPDEIQLEAANLDIEPQNNLVFQAAQLLKSHASYPHGARILLDKRIPAGAGLGGGSSDAATTLLGLNTLWGLDLSLDTLAGLGRQLGADVPVFVQGRSAWAEGVGERLTPMELPERWFLLVYPGVVVSTAAIFRHPDLTRDGSPITIARFLEQGGGNACETLVRRLYPAVDEAVRWLSQWGPARMTGTGSCVFLDLASEEEAEKILAAVPSDWSAYKAKGLNVSPAHVALGGAD